MGLWVSGSPEVTNGFYEYGQGERVNWLLTQLDKPDTVNRKSVQPPTAILHGNFIGRQPRPEVVRVKASLQMYRRYLE